MNSLSHNRSLSSQAHHIPSPALIHTSSSSSLSSFASPSLSSVIVEATPPLHPSALQRSPYASTPIRHLDKGSKRARIEGTFDDDDDDDDDASLFLDVASQLSSRPFQDSSSASKEHQRDQDRNQENVTCSDEGDGEDDEEPGQVQDQVHDQDQGINREEDEFGEEYDEELSTPWSM
jgi:hypothetical protein